MTPSDYKTRQMEILVDLQYALAAQHVTSGMNEAAKALDALLLEVVGTDEPQCNCETDDGLGYHTKYCERDGTFHGLLRNEYRASIRSIVEGEA